jgi:hypothetical protein
MGEVLDRFIRNDFDAYVRERLLAESASRSTGEVYLTFNIFNVRLDFDAASATVEDEFDPEAQETVPLAELLRRARSPSTA